MIRDYSAISTQGALTRVASAVAVTAPTQSDFCSNRPHVFSKFLLPLVLIACVFVSSASAQSGQPNIIIILADDLGYGDVAFNGCPDHNPVLFDDEPWSWWHCNSRQRLEIQRRNCLNHSNAIHGLHLQQLGGHWNRLLFGHEQSGLNHNGRPHY
jgi:hypothetical protein